ncbi:lytic transglycosylase domain-containing protein [Mesorhizobium sp. LHD-90]|uniref:lytic transglycosylase domain-containing protein n=1 Tax=Mesorhizobium sp. LHD-90 TaxID=3071414 RepID=UPI0027E1C837|nr:lytic transglycosylase domain-containing protein [Mesorhizobium sp. LHD-90]MDQ6436461.1 lytic transglycosylase domain-containing protein [Mesorhizobium sp. LHD-90]
MPDISRFLVLVAALAPVAVAGCTSTGADTSASFNMAPTDHVLPQTVSVLPSPSGEVSVASYVQPQSLSGAADAAQAAVKPAEAAQASTAVVAAKPGEAAGMSAAAAAQKPAEKPVAVAAVAKRGTAGDKAALTAFPDAPKPAAFASSGEANTPVTLASYIKPDSPNKLDQLIAKYAAVYEVPVDLVRRVVKRESNFNPAAFNRGHYGLMQIKHATARGMGYQGPAKGLFDAETNLKYAVKYLRGAYMVADGNHNRADRLYQTGYYYHAKRKGLLDETGLGKDRVRRRAGASM